MHWIKEIGSRHQLFASDTDVLNLGCKKGEIVKKLAEVVSEGQLWGIELEPSYQQQLQSLAEEVDNFRFLNDNPLLARTYEGIDQLFDVVINSLDLEPMKKLQADENAMVALRRGGLLIDTFQPSAASRQESREKFLKNKDAHDLHQIMDNKQPSDEVHEQELVANFLQNLEVDKVEWEEVSGQRLILAWKEEPSDTPFASD